MMASCGPAGPGALRRSASPTTHDTNVGRNAPVADGDRRPREGGASAAGRRATLTSNRTKSGARRSRAWTRQQPSGRSASAGPPRSPSPSTRGSPAPRRTRATWCSTRSAAARPPWSPPSAAAAAGSASTSIRRPSRRYSSRCASSLTSTSSRARAVERSPGTRTGTSAANRKGDAAAKVPEPADEGTDGVDAEDALRLRGLHDAVDRAGALRREEHPVAEARRHHLPAIRRPESSRIPRIRARDRETGEIHACSNVLRVPTLASRITSMFPASFHGCTQNRTRFAFSSRHPSRPARPSTPRTHRRLRRCARCSAGMGDRFPPDWVIDFTGMRSAYIAPTRTISSTPVNRCKLLISLEPASGLEPLTC